MFPGCYACPVRLDECPRHRRKTPIPGIASASPPPGPGSIAHLGRRAGAIAIDWACAVIISIAFFNYDAFATIVVFAIVQILFIPTLGGSPGHRLLGMRVIRLDGGVDRVCGARSCAPCCWCS